MTRTDRLLERASDYARDFKGGGAPAAPARKVVILACMDARLDPARVLGLNEGDAHVIRNAGGAASDDAIRSISISQHLLGTEEVIVIHHTDCGMQKISDEAFAERIREHTGCAPPWRARAFDDLEENLRRQVRAIKDSPFVPEVESVRGFIFEVESGRMREVT